MALREGRVRPWEPSGWATFGQAALHDPGHCEQRERESGRKGVGSAEKGASRLGLSWNPSRRKEGGTGSRATWGQPRPIYTWAGVRTSRFGSLPFLRRMQPLKAPCWSGSRLLVLATLLVLLPAPSTGRARLVWNDSPLSRRRALDTSSLPVQRAAQTAVNYFNYQSGSPNALRAPGSVKKAFLKIVPGIGRKYSLQFATKDLLTGKDLGTCDTSVFYRMEKPKPAVEINCSPDKKHQLADIFLYWALKEKNPPPEALRGLGAYSSSLIAWEMSTEDLTYSLTQIKKVKPWKSGDDALEFDYTVLLGDLWGESSISCHMRVIWKPSEPAQVKYDCSPDDSSSESADGSGEELGSTDYLYNEVENNF